MTTQTDSPSPNFQHRRIAVIRAAIDVFARFGYRKASMEEIAKSALVSRQGLYLNFSNKDDLFRAAVELAMQDQLSAAKAQLTDASLPLDYRLAAAMTEWAGRYVEVMRPHATELIETSLKLAGEAVGLYEKQFEDALILAINDANPTLTPRTDCTAPDIAQTLLATAKGLKHSCPSQEVFLQRITVATRLLCAGWLHA
ncbi:TetR/AcrR family transcriptional regulator [Pseudomonas sp.]|uniref:TetR/AcrR family transcriptional regulator n=1 Tax=Pseudomonas sp. TaxID=306 RepID=UPI00261C69A1|nr:TetR/AcrR family transcriptional regulator [Pseudomonas sp.]